MGLRLRESRLVSPCGCWAWDSPRNLGLTILLIDVANVLPYSSTELLEENRKIVTDGMMQTVFIWEHAILYIVPW